jgi:hypothetical protein
MITWSLFRTFRPVVRPLFVSLHVCSHSQQRKTRLASPTNHFHGPRGPQSSPHPSDPYFRINGFSAVLIELQSDFLKLSGLPYPPLLLYMAIQSTVVWLIACESQSRMSQRIEAVKEGGDKLGWLETRVASGTFARQPQLLISWLFRSSTFLSLHHLPLHLPDSIRL